MRRFALLALYVAVRSVPVPADNLVGQVKVFDPVTRMSINNDESSCSQKDGGFSALEG